MKITLKDSKIILSKAPQMDSNGGLLLRYKMKDSKHFEELFTDICKGKIEYLLPKGVSEKHDIKIIVTIPDKKHSDREIFLYYDNSN